jgi:hypothetical protein
MEENLLGTHSPQRQYGERAPAVRAVRAVPVTPAKPNADAPITNWPEQTFRRQTLFEVLDVLHDAYADGLLPAKDYVKIGSGTVELLIKIGRAWKAGIDENAYRSTWLANIAPLLKK